MFANVSETTEGFMESLPSSFTKVFVSHFKRGRVQHLTGELWTWIDLSVHSPPSCWQCSCDVLALMAVWAVVSYVIVRPLSTVVYTSVASVIHYRRWSDYYNSWPFASGQYNAIARM